MCGPSQRNRVAKCGEVGAHVADSAEVDALVGDEVLLPMKERMDLALPENSADHLREVVRTLCAGYQINNRHCMVVVPQDSRHEYVPRSRWSRRSEWYLTWQANVSRGEDDV